MSSYGYRKARLSPERQQELQQRRIQKQARGLLNACQKKLNSAKDPIMKKLVEKQIHSFRSQLSSISDQLQFSSEGALSSIQHL